MKKCLFIGSKEFGVIGLRTIYEIEPKSLIGCLTIDDKHDCRSKFYEIKNYCDIKQIPIEVVYKHCQLSEYIKKYKPDFCIVLGWYQIIEKNILDMCPDGFIGVHASLLPRYRGFAPLVWAILNGEKKQEYLCFILMNIWMKAI